MKSGELSSEMRVDRRHKPGGPRGFWSQKITDDQYREKLFGKCTRTPIDCLLWKGTKNHKGYGYMSYRGRTWATHRLAYLLEVGEIPKGKLVCHTCDTRSCCQPRHLFIGTEATNNRDCGNKGRHHNGRKTHCVRGHEFTFENTALRVGKGTVMRVCKTCAKMHMREDLKNGKALARQRRRRARIKASQRVT